MAYDLIIQAPQDGSPVSHGTLDQLRTALMHFTCEVVFLDGPDSRPGEEELAEAMEEGEVDKEEFFRFCREHELPEDLTERESARQYLESLWGRDLAMVVMPDNPKDAHHVMAELRRIGTRLGLPVWDPQMGATVDLTGETLPSAFA
jgi:hypothetical protein